MSVSEISENMNSEELEIETLVECEDMAEAEEMLNDEVEVMAQPEPENGFRKLGLSALTCAQTH
jgi:hypothetical protein